jgi:zinc protease
MKIETIEKINNLNTLFINSKDSTSGSVQIWFRAGSSLEETSNQGIAHFLEHMFFKGTKKRPGHIIAKDIESFGGQVNAFTSFDYTCYYINAPSNKLDESADIIIDMVSNPEFKQSELVPEREVVFEEYLRSLDNPSRVNFQNIQDNIFSDGYQHSILGTEKNIKTFTRSQLTHFRKKFYNLSNSLLIVSGDLSKKSLKNKIKKIVSNHKIPKGPKTSFSNFNLKKKTKINVHKTNVRQASLTMAFQAKAYDDNETYAEDLALSTIGLGESSTLHQILVQNKQFATSTAASTMYLADGGVHFIRFNFPLDNFEKLTDEFLDILKDCLKNGIEEDQIQKIKNQYTSLKIFEKESIDSFTFSLGHSFAQTGDIHCEKKFIEGINETSQDDVNLGLKNILNHNCHYILQIPKTRILR